ncbi:MAG: cupin domain-containing protein [Planctomycetota bacterium]|nr:cupin domain-containing protein [Planctomycetota bacterium]
MTPRTPPCCRGIDYRLNMEPIDLEQALSSFDEHWSPRIIAQLNGQHVKLAKFTGEYVWHSHPDEDEFFMVLSGSFTMEFRDHAVELGEGQVIVVPRGVEHRPVAESECAVMLFEPAGTVSTGDAEASERTSSGTWIGDSHPGNE